MLCLTRLTTLLFVFFIFVAVAQAQATRTWVSGLGDDANTCSRTAPCKTFAGAIGKTAASGEINVMDPGGFGAVSITKAITIDGSGGNIAGVLVSGSNGIAISAGAGDAVILRNLDINGLSASPTGIMFNSGKSLRIENSKIYGFTNGIDFAPTGTSTLFIEKTDVYNNSSAGLYVAPAGGSGHATVIDSTFSGNLYGIEASGASAVVYISGITATQNTTGLSTTSGGGIWAQGNNRILGNTSDGTPTGYLPQNSGPLVIH